MFGRTKAATLRLFDVDYRHLDKVDQMILWHEVPKHLQTSIDNLFIEISKESGLLQDEYRHEINVEALREPVRSELRDLFQLPENKRLKYDDFRKSMMELLNSSIARSSGIQQSANQYIQNLIHTAQKIVKEPYVQEDQKWEETSSTESEGSDLTLFRTTSIGPDIFSRPSGPRDYFVPNEMTMRLFNESFVEFFSEQGGSESRLKTEVIDQVLQKYSQMWEIFGSTSGKKVTRVAFAETLCHIAEHGIKSNEHIKSIAYSYFEEKLNRANRKLKEFIASAPEFVCPVGTRVLLKLSGYNDHIPATVTEEVVESSGTRMWKVALDHDPYGDVIEAYRASLKINDGTEAIVQNESEASAPLDPVAQVAIDRAILRDEHTILNALSVRLGPRFEIVPKESIPPLEPSQYSFWFKYEGKKIDFEFDQYDFGVRYKPQRIDCDFLPDEYFLDDVFSSAQLQTSISAQETNRCFFLHLGVALKIHPYALTVAYRQLAKEIIAVGASDDLPYETSMSVLTRNTFVDAMTLACIWPVELDEYQILIVNLDHNSNFNQFEGFTLIRPPNSRALDSSGVWRGKDIILTLQLGHFTYLQPKSEIILNNPIETLLEWARKIQVGVSKPFDLYPDPYSSGEERLSIYEALQDFLADGPPPPESEVSPVLATGNCDLTSSEIETGWVDVKL